MLGHKLQELTGGAKRRQSILGVYVLIQVTVAIPINESVVTLSLIKKQIQ
ncbi:hypothetical protein [Pseudanabaena sp. UWO310]|nr:hypothetical protein [Pseudanabaena sp. UWO310]